MRVSKNFLVPVAILAPLALSACGGSSHRSSAGAAAPSSSGSPAALVKTAPSSKLGATVLVDSRGMTLYRLSAEHAGKFICTSSGCLQLWHPLTVRAGQKPAGTVSLGLVKRPDGSEQVTYKGMPLYTFARDSAPGQANGQGFKDVGTWNAVTTSAASSKTSSSTPASPSSGGGGSSYSY